MVYLEDLTSALWVENVDEVDRYNVFFNHLRATALSFESSAALMTAGAEGDVASLGAARSGSGSACSTVSRETARVSAT